MPVAPVLWRLCGCGGGNAGNLELIFLAWNNERKIGMIRRPKTVFEKVAEKLMDVTSRDRCPVCGGKVSHEYFHPPFFVRDGSSGLRKRCTTCGHVEIAWCRSGI